MKHLIYILFFGLLVVSTGPSFAQIRNGYCPKADNRLAGRTTVANPAEDDYDIKYVKFNLNMTNVSTMIIGDVSTTAMVTAPTMADYVFELDSVYTIDSVLVNGISRPVSSMASLRTVILVPALPYGAIFTAEVFYRGACTTGLGYFGINSVPISYMGPEVTYTMSESYHSNEWWPCKQSLHDKIDSTDMWVTVPKNLKVGSNGLLDTVMVIDTAHVRYQWKERYPIDYYLVSVAIADYVDYSYYMHFSGSTDSMLIKNYVYDSATLIANKLELDSLADLINYFTTIYGRFPFWKEKYGISEAPIGVGGMENQTMSTLGTFDPVIMAHELGHQWFGDNVTCGTWRDITMNEGYASYTEDLFRDHFHSHAEMIADIQSKQAGVEGYGPGTIYVADTTREYNIFNGNFTYNKGACVLHMLRYVIDNDSQFFQVYRAYQSQMKDSTGTILDFKNTLEGVLGNNINGINIDSFYNQWYFEEGLPIYNITWNQVGNDVWVQITQNTTIPSSVPLFNVPLDLDFNAGYNDTLVRVTIDSNAQLFHFTWTNTEMHLLFIDPLSWMVFQLDSITRDSTLSLSTYSFPKVAIFPNPATSAWQVSGLSAGTGLELSDVTGRVVWQANSGNSTSIIIPSSGLTAGVYILRAGDKMSSNTFKLLKE